MAIIVTSDAVGRLLIKTVDDATGAVSRTVVEPGHVDNGVYIVTDISGMSQPVQAKAAAVWTADVLAAFQQAAIAAAAPIPPSADQILTGKIFANARRKAIITAIQTSDDVQLAALIAARYPTLNGDAIKAVTDIFLTLAGYIRN